MKKYKKRLYISIAVLFLAGLLYIHVGCTYSHNFLIPVASILQGVGIGGVCSSFSRQKEE